MTRQMPACPPRRVLPAGQRHCAGNPGGPFAEVTSQSLRGELSAHCSPLCLQGHAQSKHFI